MRSAHLLLALSLFTLGCVGGPRRGPDGAAPCCPDGVQKGEREIGPPEVDLVDVDALRDPPMPELLALVEPFDPNEAPTLFRIDGETGIASSVGGLNEQVDGNVSVHVVELADLDRFHVVLADGVNSPIVQTYATSTGEAVAYARLDLDRIQTAFALPNQELAVVHRNLVAEKTEIRLVDAESGETTVIAETELVFAFETVGPGGLLYGQRTVHDATSVQNRLVTIDPWTGIVKLDIEMAEPAKRILRDGTDGLMGLFATPAGIEVRALDPLTGAQQLLAPMGVDPSLALANDAVAVDDYGRLIAVRQNADGSDLVAWDRTRGGIDYEVPLEVDGIVRAFVLVD